VKLLTTVNRSFLLKTGKNLDFLTKNLGFQVFQDFRILQVFDFNLQISDSKLRPASTVKSKDKSSEQRFGHVNATNRKFIFEHHFYKINYTISEKTEKPKIRTSEVLRFLNQKPTFFKTHFYSPASVVHQLIKSVMVCVLVSTSLSSSSKRVYSVVCPEVFAAKRRALLLQK